MDGWPQVEYADGDEGEYHVAIEDMQVQMPVGAQLRVSPPPVLLQYAQALLREARRQEGRKAPLRRPNTTAEEHNEEVNEWREKSE